MLSNKVLKGLLAKTLHDKAPWTITIYSLRNYDYLMDFSSLWVVQNDELPVSKEKNELNTQIVWGF